MELYGALLKQLIGRIECYMQGECNARRRAGTSVRYKGIHVCFAIEEQLWGAHDKRHRIAVLYRMIPYVRTGQHYRCLFVVLRNMTEMIHFILGSSIYR